MFDAYTQRNESLIVTDFRYMIRYKCLDECHYIKAKQHKIKQNKDTLDLVNLSGHANEQTQKISVDPCTPHFSTVLTI